MAGRERGGAEVSGSGTAAGAFDLDGRSIAELTDLIRRAEALRASRLSEARQRLVAEMAEKARALGLTLADIVVGTPPAAGRRAGGKRRPRAPGGVLYRGPEGRTWSGRGRVPGWMAEHEKAGRSRDELRA